MALKKDPTHAAVWKCSVPCKVLHKYVMITRFYTERIFQTPVRSFAIKDTALLAFVMEPSERFKKQKTLNYRTCRIAKTLRVCCLFDSNSTERAELLRLYEFDAYLEKDQYLALHLHLIFPEPGDKSYGRN